MFLPIYNAVSFVYVFDYFIDFNLDEFLVQRGYENSNPLSDLAVTMLMEHLEIGSYFSEDQCNIGETPFLTNTDNWNKGVYRYL